MSKRRETRNRGHLLTNGRRARGARRRPDFSPRAVRQRVRRGLLALWLAALLLALGGGEYRPTNLEVVAAPYRYSLLSWELGNLPDRTLRKLGQALSFRPGTTQQQRLAQAQEFFRLGLEAARLESRLTFPGAIPPGTPLLPQESSELRQRIEEIQRQQRLLRPGVEDTIEATVSEELSRRGLGTPIGVFPPVDVVFSRSPNVLVTSPRDRIHRDRDLLLQARLDNRAKEEMEARILREEDQSALVLGTGGVAFYPSVVSNRVGLRHAVEVTAHEWLHQWFIFRPLGRNFWSSPEMAVLNETAATIAGEELGDLAFSALTGQTVERAEREADPVGHSAEPPGDGFDFAAEMRRTRAQAEMLLAQGKTEQAEAYMDERRRVFVENGYLIRKINQAFFAFHGTYATSGASISPIGGQLEELRRRSSSLEDFIHTVARFGAYQEFLEYLETPPAVLPSGGN